MGDSFEICRTFGEVWRKRCAQDELHLISAFPKRLQKRPLAGHTLPNLIDVVLKFKKKKLINSEKKFIGVQSSNRREESNRRLLANNVCRFGLPKMVLGSNF